MAGTFDDFVAPELAGKHVSGEMLGKYRRAVKKEAAETFSALDGRVAALESAGPQGEKGDKGDPGTAATVSVGTVTTGAAGTSAKVTNAGTTSAAVLNFTIPRGATGAAGATGEKGDTGAAGTPAYTAITKSALNALIKAGNADQDTVYLVTDADTY